MTIAADDIREHILTGSGITGYIGAPFRDDAAAPFSNLSRKILWTSGAGLGADEYVSNDTCRIFLLTKVNPTGADIKQCRDDCETVRQFLIQNYQTNSAFGIQLIAGMSGPFFDGQNRKAYSLNIRIKSDT